MHFRVLYSIFDIRLLLRDTFGNLSATYGYIWYRTVSLYSQRKSRSSKRWNTYEEGSCKNPCTYCMAYARVHALDARALRNAMSRKHRLFNQLRKLKLILPEESANRQRPQIIESVQNGQEGDEMESKPMRPTYTFPT